jgi:hypothetical protein
VGPRAGLDDVEKRKFLTLPGLELRLLGRPARSQSLYRLSYPGSYGPSMCLLKYRHFGIKRSQAIFLKERNEGSWSCSMQFIIQSELQC